MPINAEYRGPGDLPEVIPVFPLPGALLLPRGQMPLNIFEPRYLNMVDDAMAALGVWSIFALRARSFRFDDGLRTVDGRG